MSLVRKSNGAFGQGPVYGDDVIPHYGDIAFSAEVSAASARFWQRDEIRGWDENGERIGTGIPRVRPNDRSNEFDWFFTKNKKRKYD
jgi:hypothetical protein